jgi:MFS transporter, PPP family, 3-phenylpropionic acid transporter
LRQHRLRALLLCEFRIIMQRLRRVLGVPETRVGAFYFIMFMGAGLSTPYVPLWMAHIGLTSSQISFSLALPQYLMIAFGIFVGRLADRASDWRAAIIVCAWLSLLCMLGLFINHAFWMVSLAWAASASCSVALTSVLDAASLRMTRRRGTEFAWLRGAGSAAFVLFALLSGYFVDLVGIETFVVALVGLTLLRALAALLLPNFRGGAASAEPAQQTATVDTVTVPPMTTPVANSRAWRRFQFARFDVVDMVGSGLRLSRGHFFATLLAVAFLNGSHAFLFLFGALHWTSHGLSTTQVGALWAVSTVAEIALMLAFRRYFTRFSSFSLLIGAGLVAMVRWCLLAVVTAFPLLLLCQSLHAFSFALVYLGSMNFVANWTHERNAAEALGLMGMMSAGMLASVGLLSGQVYDLLGGHAFFIAAGLALWATVQIAWVSMQARQAGPGADQRHMGPATSS